MLSRNWLEETRYLRDKIWGRLMLSGNWLEETRYLRDIGRGRLTCIFNISDWVSCHNAVR